ncbi:hypothetical protein A3962_00580 [Meiothermus taiwanensis]|nr:hypothetical protein A3962_00580 [Meiothermus taiwanensis]
MGHRQGGGAVEGVAPEGHPGLGVVHRQVVEVAHKGVALGGEGVPVGLAGEKQSGAVGSKAVGLEPDLPRVQGQKPNGVPLKAVPPQHRLPLLLQQQPVAQRPYLPGEEVALQAVLCPVHDRRAHPVALALVVPHPRPVGEHQVQPVAFGPLQPVLLHHHPLAVFHIEVVQEVRNTVGPEDHVVAAVGLEAGGGLGAGQKGVFDPGPVGLLDPDARGHPLGPQPPHQAALAAVEHHRGVGLVEVVARPNVSHLEALHHNPRGREGEGTALAPPHPAQHRDGPPGAPQGP